ncbi:MAG TPA: efflux RND transporter permease subunit, partial [Thermoanaerobaculia bacterium]|nr:efflux RND transporter permease subunit [Thermoanaerobaculia bacterium]
MLLSQPEVISTARRTGRAELDEHAQDVNSAEIDARFELKERSKDEFLKALRADLATIPGMVIQIGGPLSHRIDHMLSGTRANIAVKLFGDDISQLRSTAEEIRRAMEKVDGIADLSVEQQVDIPQLTIAFDRDRIARYGLRAGELAETIEAAYAGRKVTQVLESQRTYDVVIRYEDSHRESVEAVRATLVDTPSGAKVPLGALATIRQDAGPNVVMRENAQRRIVVMANIGGRDLGSVVADIRAAVARHVKLPSGYYVVYGGQFESEGEATRTIGLLSLFV